MKRTTSTILICLISFTIQAQNSLFSPSETFILQLLASDTVSSCINYLPLKFSFGIINKPPLHFILVKEKKTTYFLTDGSQQVYQLYKNDDTFSFNRLDSTKYSGSNFGMMPFIRNDTLMQYGGYGFWQTRDFFTFFMPRVGEWEVAQGTGRLATEYNPYFFDRESDKFYLLNRTWRDPTQNNSPLISDSVYSFDWKNRQWKTLGKKNERNELQIPIETFTWNGNDMSWVLPGSNELTWIDFPRNQLNKLTSTKRDEILNIIQYFGREGCAIDQSALIHLKDTLYFINENKGTLIYRKIGLLRSSFDTLHGTRIYDPLPTTFGHQIGIDITSNQLMAPLALMVMAGGLIIHRKRKKLKNKMTADAPIMNEPYPIETVETPPLDSYAVQESLQQELNRRKTDFQFFLNTLTPVERELLKSMVTSSLDDRKMDISSINKILGVTNKEPEIQKTRRSVSINHINETFINTMKQSNMLLCKERDEFDKRSFVYFVPIELASWIEPLLNS